MPSASKTSRTTQTQYGLSLGDAGFHQSTLRIPPGTETRGDRYPAEFRPWTGRPDAFRQLRGRIPSGYTKDILEYLCDLILLTWRSGQTFGDVPAVDWQHTWKETCTCPECVKRGVKASVMECHVIGTPAIDPKEVAGKLGCSVRTVQNSLSEAWEIGCTARRKVGKRYAYTILFEDFHRVRKAQEPETNRGPVAISTRESKPEVQGKDAGFASTVQTLVATPTPIQRLEPVADQQHQYRFEMETVAGEPARIRVIQIGEREANKPNENQDTVRATFCANGCKDVDSKGSKSETEAKPSFPPIVPDDAKEALQLTEAIAQLRSRSIGPLGYTTLVFTDYVQVTIFDRRRKKGVMPTARDASNRPELSTDTMAAGKQGHEAILAAIPPEMFHKFGKIKSPVLIEQIAANLSGAPLKNFTSKIKSRWQAITSPGVLAMLAADVGKEWANRDAAPTPEKTAPRPAKKKKTVFDELAEMRQKQYGK